MEFLPAGDIIGSAHQVRMVGIRESSLLPDGDYTFVDSYCIDTSCDCRRTLILVVLNNTHVSTVGFGWEPIEFYRKWMNGEPDNDEDDDIVSLLHGATIDISSPDKVSAQGMLTLFNELLDEKWIANFKRNYSAVKAQLAKRSKTKNSRTKNISAFSAIMKNRRIYG